MKSTIYTAAYYAVSPLRCAFTLISTYFPQYPVLKECSSLT